jgi:hypothetical protein
MLLQVLLNGRQFIGMRQAKAFLLIDKVLDEVLDKVLKG